MTQSEVDALSGRETAPSGRSVGWKGKFFHLLCIETCLQLGLYSMNPIVSSYAVYLGASVAAAGLIAGLNATTSLVIRPITGIITDMLNKKSLLVFSCVLFICAALGCAFATSPAIVGLCRALQGIGFAFKSAITVSLAALVVPRDRLGGGVGSLGTAFTVACSLGPLVGDALSGMFGYPASFGFSVALFFVGFVLVLAFKVPQSARGNDVLATAPESRLSEKFKSALRLSSMFYLPSLPLTLVVCFTQIAQGTNMVMILLVGDMRGVSGISLYFLVYAAVTFFTKPLGGRISDEYGCAVVVVPGAIMAASAMVLLAFSFSLPTALLAAFLMGTGHGALFSTIQSESVRGVPPDKVGRAANMFYIGSDFGMGFGPFLSGAVMQAFGATAGYLFAGASVLCGLALFLALCKTGRVKRAIRRKSASERA